MTISGNGCTKRLALQLPAVSPADLSPPGARLQKDSGVQEARETEPVWPSGKAGKQKDLSSMPLRLSFSFLSKSLWFVDTVL